MTLLKHSTSQVCVSTILLLPSAAFAEVCDKEVPTWDFTTGPASQLEYFVAATTSPIGISILGVLVLAIAFRRLWLQILGGVLILLVVLGIVSLQSDPVYLASIREGCRAEPHWLLFALAAVFFFFAALTVKTWKGRRCNS